MSTENQKNGISILFHQLALHVIETVKRPEIKGFRCLILQDKSPENGSSVILNRWFFLQNFWKVKLCMTFNLVSNSSKLQKKVIERKVIMKSLKIQ